MFGRSKQRLRSIGLLALTVFVSGVYLLPTFHLLSHSLPHVHFGDAIRFLEPERLDEIGQREARVSGHDRLHELGLAHRDAPNDGRENSRESRERDSQTPASEHGSNSASHFTALITDAAADLSPLLPYVSEASEAAVNLRRVSIARQSIDTDICRGPPSLSSPARIV